VGQSLKEKQEETLLLTLIGAVNAHLPFFLMAFDRAGSQGVGQGRGRFSLEAVWEEGALGEENFLLIYTKGNEKPMIERQRIAPKPTVAPCDGTTLIEFLSPLRVRFGEDLVTPERFTFGIFFRNLLRRLSLLMAFYGKCPLNLDYKAFVEKADSVSLQGSHLTWKEWTRFSSRQKSSMKMGGLIGSVSIDSRELGPFWEYLWWGQWTCTGKGTTMGMGEYRLQGQTRNTLEGER
jgi:hypothetical protein